MSLFNKATSQLALAIVWTLPMVHPLFAVQDSHKPITEELILLIEQNPAVGRMLEKSLAAAKEINPDKQTNPAQNLSDYYDYVDEAAELIPQTIRENPRRLIRDQILQSICYFYFLVDQPLDELEGKGLYRNTIQYYEPFSSWLRDFAVTWGEFLDTEESWSAKTYQEFRNDPRFGLKKGWYESPSNWHTFNRFFCRYLRSPAERPIASPDDPSVVASPADSVSQGVWAIDDESKIAVQGGLKVKLTTYYSVKDLLGGESQYKDAFANGVLSHTFLNVYDYHRYHFAVGGTIKEKKNIIQNVSVEVSWSPEQGRYVPVDSTGWQFTQTRGFVIVDTGQYGLVALIPMGMAHVSSVNFEDNVTVGAKRAKGDMLGTFLFGGSDFVMLFQEQAGFEITVPHQNKIITRPGIDHGHTFKVYDHLLMGQKYGVMKGSSR